MINPNIILDKSAVNLPSPTTSSKSTNEDNILYTLLKNHHEFHEKYYKITVHLKNKDTK